MGPILTSLSAGQGLGALAYELCGQCMDVFDADRDGRINLAEFIAVNRFFFLVACLDEDDDGDVVSTVTGRVNDDAVATAATAAAMRAAAADAEAVARSGLDSRRLCGGGSVAHFGVGRGGGGRGGGGVPRGRSAASAARERARGPRRRALHRLQVLELRELLAGSESGSLG